MKGTVKTLTEKGFGFISVPGSKKDMFFHSNNLNNMRFADMKVGDEVEFDVEEGQKGPFASNIDVLTA